jgi:hypothetical protein
VSLPQATIDANTTIKSPVITPLVFILELPSVLEEGGAMGVPDL